MEVHEEDRVVVVVAHPDDETFGCGSLIAWCVAAGATVTVICATRGEGGERLPDPATDALPLGEVREHELRAAAAVLGAHRIEVLDHADSGFDGDMPCGALCAADVEAVAAHLVTRLDELGADLVITLDGSDGHRDHVYVRAALEVALTRTAKAAPLVLSSLSNALMRRWVQEMQALNPGTAYLGLDLDTLGAPDDLLTVVDTAPQYELRERAIACHRSQRSPYDGLSPELRRAFLAQDHVLLMPARV